ncbi:MAG: tetratricopeptide repeat protein [Treponema sp.]|nr:tetratricopeptide repeat protein [Treponema sp.]MBQ6566097.1 tetratricopeptide repeat protein [Treponema sp.]MBQ7166650.1 tetratricopeptide repeat protein [Treponema sp.]
MYFLIFIGVLVLVAVAIVLVLKGRSTSGKDMPDIKNRNEAKILKDATRKLEKDPDNIAALTQLSEIFYTNGVFDKAVQYYRSLVRIAPVHSEIDEAKVALRAGICLCKAQEWGEALKYLLQSSLKDGSNFDVNYHLGLVYSNLKDYAKAVPCLKKALIVNPASTQANMLVARCFYEQHHYKEALPYLKVVIAAEPNNKEAMFDYADVMVEEGHGEKSIKIFSHLRPDPTYGARSCIRSGVYHYNQGDKKTAIEDFTIGLKLPNTPQADMLELKYRLAICYFDTNRYKEGLALLSEVKQVNPQYKDIPTLISRYSELSQNSNLQIYLAGSVSDFIALCRRIATGWERGMNANFIDANAESAYTDITVEVPSRGGDGSEVKETWVFRFFRTTGATGEIYVREFHEMIQDQRVGRGICITAGTFTEGARKYSEGRPVDLIERDKLDVILKRIN